MTGTGRRIQYQPYEYQQKAISFLMDKPRSLLCLDMGLGKTSITLYAITQLIEDYAVSRVLIIAPKFVAMDTWKREAAKWDFSRELKLAVAVGTAAERQKAIESDADIVTINRENVQWLIEKYGRAFPFDGIVIDESTSFKSYSSKRFKALRKVTPGMRWMTELTGTPMPTGSLEALWPQVYLLDGGERLGRSMTSFRYRYETPGKRNGMIIYQWDARPGAKDEVFSAISDISMSMKAEDWLSVPEEVTIDHMMDLPEKCRKQYRQLERDFILECEESDIVGVNAGALAGKLLQFANGAVYDENGEVQEFHDEKLQVLEEILEGTEEPVMVFYWFKHDFQRLKKYFEAMDPQTIRGPEDIRRWNEGKIRLLLVHPASMGHGLNLQEGGHIIVWFGLTYSLEVYLQANARLHRQGQKNKVQIHRIIAKGTADENVTAALDRKDHSQKELIEAIKADITGRMTEWD